MQKDLISKDEFKQILENILSAKNKKEIIAYVKWLQLKYGFFDCKYLSWEMEGSICNCGHGTAWGRCVEWVENKECPFKKLK